WPELIVGPGLFKRGFRVGSCDRCLVRHGLSPALVLLEKVACGAFSDSGSVSASKRRDFCCLRSAIFVRHGSNELLNLGGQLAEQVCVRSRIDLALEHLRCSTDSDRRYLAAQSLPRVRSFELDLLFRGRDQPCPF